MSITAIILIILLGILLLFVEFFIIPGISVAGIGGILLIGGGIYSAFRFLGTQTGVLFLLFSSIALLAMLLYAFRAKTWKNFGLESEINSKFETFDKEKIKKGNIGVAITRLAPMGKVQVNDIICEAKSTMQFIDVNSEVEVVEVENTKIIVKLKK